MTETNAGETSNSHCVANSWLDSCCFADNGLFGSPWDILYGLHMGFMSTPGYISLPLADVTHFWLHVSHDLLLPLYRVNRLEMWPLLFALQGSNIQIHKQIACWFAQWCIDSDAYIYILYNVIHTGCIFIAS